MGYETYLIELLRPLGVYDLSVGTINRGELTCYGGLLDQGLSHLEESRQEMSPVTAQGFGLEQIEALFPHRPVSDTLEMRRAALIALLRIGGDSFTLKTINETLAGCGVNAKVRETGEPNYVEVWFPDVPGVPDGVERIRTIIEEILPCHLGIEYVFWYLAWAEAGEKFQSWAEIQGKGLTWTQLSSDVI